MAALQYTVGSGQNYATLALAEAGTRQNLTSGGGNTIEFLIQQAFQETRAGSGITFGAGWTTSATCTITITVPKAYRHTGKRGTGYRITGDFDWYLPGLTITSNVIVNGVAVQCTDGGNNNCRGISADGTSNTTLRNCFIADCAGSNLAGIGIVAGGTNTINCIMVGCDTGFRADTGAYGDPASYAYNNTILNCIQGIDLGNGNGRLLLKNTYIGNSGNPSIAVQGGILDTIVTSATSDGFTGTTTITVVNCHFTTITAGSEDLHIASTSYLCHGVHAGTDLHTGDTYYNFSTDFEDDARPNGSWDIGADQYVSGSTTYEVSTTETGTLSDSQSSQAVLVASITETGTLSSVQSSQAVLVASITETGTLLDTQTSAGPNEDRTVTIGSGKDYSTIADALDGEDNFQEGEVNIVFVIDAAEYPSFEIPAKFTPDVDHRLQFRCATNSFHNFIRNTGVVIKNSTSFFTQGAHDPAYTEYYGIAFTIDNEVDGIDAALEFGYSSCLAYGCFAYDVYGSTGYNEGLIVTDRVVGAEYSKFINCAAVNCAGVGIGAQNLTVGVTEMLIYNCIVLNCGFGFRPSGGRVNYIKNCYAGGCTGGAYIDGGDVPPIDNPFDITTCFGDDGTKSTSVISIDNCHFINKDVGTEVITFTNKSYLRHTVNPGTDLHADAYYEFDTDAYGTIRPNGSTTWDIGPYQFNGSEFIFKPIIIFIG